MHSDLIFIRNKLVIFFASALFLCLMMGLVFIDVHWMHDAVHESSLTEITQELMLLVIAFLYFYRAMRHSAARPSLMLIGGFFSCMLIREMDFLFDEIKHGCWVWFALAVTGICLTFAIRYPERTLAGLVSFLRHPSWGMMSAGLLTVLVFSRLFGMQDLWRALMPGGYSHTVKNMAEECSELLGYSLCLFATCRYLRSDYALYRHTS
jgi:hypothetical protein